MNWRDLFATPPAAAFSEERTEGIARRLIQYAARNAPPELSERLEEEWLADLATRQGRMAQWRFGVGCCWATRVIAHDFCEAKVPAASTATGPKIMAAYAQHDSPLFSRRTTIFFLILGFHVFLIYALETGLGHRMIVAIPPRTDAYVVPDPLPPNEPPPPPSQPTFSHPPINVPQPEFPADDLSDRNTIQELTPQPNAQPLPSTPMPQRAVSRVMGGPGKGFPNTDDYYPSAARRLGEQGISAVRVCVDEKGRLTEAPTLAQSSGSARIDEGALKLAKAGSGHYRPSTEEGRPVSSCFPFRIRYEFKD